MKKFISGLIIGGVLMTSVSALAATAVNLQAYYSIKSLVVNGVDTGKGNTAFVVDGTTYVPLRTVSDALGNEIAWDSNTKTVYINTKTNSTTGDPTDLPAVGNTTNNTTNNTTTTSGTWNGQTLVSIETAQNAAIKAVGGGSVLWKESDIYEKDDLPTYDFKISYNNRIYEVEINALTGAVKDFDID